MSQPECSCWWRSKVASSYAACFALSCSFLPTPNMYLFSWKVELERKRQKDWSSNIYWFTPLNDCKGWSWGKAGSFIWSHCVVRCINRSWIGSAEASQIPLVLAWDAIFTGGCLSLCPQLQPCILFCVNSSWFCLPLNYSQPLLILYFVLIECKAQWESLINFSGY